ncbi:MAG: hypothetical protein KZQ99_18170 [Candidatus Thiodiazotropha sp. (ex Dulcina madagascariensis)]|nr:hypothetical protein [Candidatus Thiodiazotropha sp. (ex Dulcina madagascariensis)]
MKKLLINSLSLFALGLSSLGAQAATYDAGTFYPANNQGDYTIDATGTFWDEFDFYAYSRCCGRDNVYINFSGSHEGMFNDELLLINLNTRQTYTLGTDFSETFDLRYNQRFAITGSGLNAIDPEIFSSYNLSIDSVAAVPIPAAAWLFASGLLGFVSFGKKRKALLNTTG